MDARKIQAEFLATYREDLASERVRPLAEYQAMFRGHESTIAAEYAYLEEDEHGDPVTGDDAAAGAAEIDRYRILRELGRGGQAKVYLAHDPRLGRDVALKVLETSRLGLGAGTHIARLRREAELTAGLDHPGICQVFDVGEDVSRGLAYIAMRRVEGATLARLIALSADRHPSSSAVSLPRFGDSDDLPSTEQPSGRAIERRSVHRVIELIEKAARALHVAHESGLIHRDVKPGNIMVTDDGEPVVLDFGLAREESSTAHSLTVSGDVIGTPYYMSPEQLATERVALDRRTDVYSLGVTLYECLTLRRPFEAHAREALYQQILSAPASDPRARNRHITRDLKVVVETALDKDRERRYPTALAFADDLRRVRQFEPIAARPLPSALRLKRWVKRNPAPATFVVVLAVALIVTYVLLRKMTALARAAASVEASLSDPTLGLRLALEAVDLDERPETLSALQTALALQHVVCEIQAHTGPVKNLSFSAKHRLLLSAGPRDGTACLFTLDGTCVAKFKHGEGEGVGVVAARFSPQEDRILTACEDGAARLWNLQGQPLTHPMQYHKPLTDAVWSPDGTEIVTGADDGSVAVWNATDGSLRRRTDGHTKPVTGILFAPSGETVTYSSDGTVRIWRRDRPDTLIRHGEPVTIAAVHPDGSQLVTGDDRGTVRLWTLDGRPIRDLEGHTGTIHTVSFSADGSRLLTGSRDGSARLWRRDGTPIRVVGWHGGDVFGAVFLDDRERVLTWSGDTTAQIWSDDSQPLLTFRGKDGIMSAIALPEEGLVVTGSSAEGALRIWAIHGVNRTRLGGHENRVWDFDFGPTGELVTAGMDGRVRIWSAQRRLENTLDADQPIYSVAISPDGTRVLAGTRDGHIVIWDRHTGKELRGRRHAHEWRIWTLRFSPDGRSLLTVSGGNTALVWLWDGELGEKLQQLRPTATQAMSRQASWSRDGLIAISGVGGHVQVFRPTGEVVGPEPRLDIKVFSVVFDNDGSDLLTASYDTTAVLWTREGERKATYAGHRSTVRSAVFSADGKRVLTASKDGTARLWERDGTLVFSMREPEGQVIKAGFSPDGKWILSASSEGHVRFWPATAELLLRTARDRAVRTQKR